MTNLSLFLDLDGTLIELADRPDAVIIPQQLPTTLRCLDTNLNGAVAMISGRNIRSLDSLLFPYCGPAIGVHGTEMRRSCTENTRRTSLPLSIEAKQAVAAILQRYPGSFAEDKETAIAIHVRADVGVVRVLADELSTICAELIPGWRCIAGHKVLEIKPLAFDKGTGLDWLMEQSPFAETIPVAIGDDITDLDMFAVAKRRGGLSISVGERILGHGECHLRSPTAVFQLLEKWVGCGPGISLADVDELAKQLRFL